jgi:alkanesulfonate monooxygenase SsuD/methylene tetrahydromethanopterin reductase-like flavin-dependent oxidoreductase (luciferase family)
MPGIASATTAVVIGYIAGGTRTIRVASAVSCCQATRRW